MRVVTVRLRSRPVRGPGVLRLGDQADSGQTSAPDGLGPRRRARGSEIGSMVIRCGINIAARDRDHEIAVAADSDPVTGRGGQGEEGCGSSVDADQLLGADGSEHLAARGPIAGGQP